MKMQGCIVELMNKINFHIHYFIVDEFIFKSTRVRRNESIIYILLPGT